MKYICLQLKCIVEEVCILDTFKTLKNILLQGIFYVLALQILNLSVDIDYVVSKGLSSPNLVNYDDIDSFSEYVLEKIMGDNNFTSENDDDDDGSSRSKGIERYDASTLYYEQFARPQLCYTAIHGSSLTYCPDRANKDCKGYISIVSPPPRMQAVFFSLNIFT